MEPHENGPISAVEYTDVGGVRLEPGRDSDWIFDLTGYEVDDQQLEIINNQLITVGSLDIDAASPDLKLAIRKARTEFYEGTLDLAVQLPEQYARFRAQLPDLAPIAPFISMQRRLYRARQRNTPHSDESSDLLGLDLLRIINEKERLEYIDEFGIDSVSTPSRVSAGKIRAMHDAIESIEGLDFQKMTRGYSKILTRNLHDILSKIDFLRSQGVEAGVINTNAAMLSLSMDSIQKRFGYLQRKGLDPARAVNWNKWILNTSQELLDARFQALEDARLDPMKVLRNNPNLFNSDPALVRKKLLLIKSILRYYGSSTTAEELGNAQPMILTRNMQKLRSTVRVMEGAVDREYMASRGAGKFDAFAMKPLDTILSTVIQQKTLPDFAPDGIEVKHVVAVYKVVKSSDRRRHNLDLLADEAVQNMVGQNALRAYFSYQPLTPQELVDYPMLGSLAEN